MSLFFLAFKVESNNGVWHFCVMWTHIKHKSKFQGCGYCYICRALSGCGLTGSFPYQLASSLPQLQTMYEVFNLSSGWWTCVYVVLRNQRSNL
jgi:hypothetical protein